METPKIYLVEDDVFYNRTLQYVLRAGEFKNVKAFSNQEDFLREFKYQEPDMVILDYNLGDTTGIELLKKIKALSARTKVVIISASSKKDISREALLTGATSFIQKDKLTFSKLKVLARKIAREKTREKREAIAA